MNRTSRRHKLLLISGIITAGAVALADCSSSKASTSAGPKPGQVTLVVYSAQGYDHAMTAAFTKATGIPVKLDDNSTGPLLTQIEASRNNPNWGLLWVDGATAFAGLDQQGLLQKGFEPSVKWDTLGQQSLPSDKSYTPTGVTLMAAMVYDKTKVTSPPSTWQQRAVLPVVSRPIVMAWLLTFCAVFLELPISQLLYAPGSPPASIAIEDNLGNYHFGVGMAQAVLAVGITLAAVLIVLGGYRPIAPDGWRRIGGASRG
jgi:hypothetical protein